MEWAGLIVGAIVGALLQSVFELLVPGPSVVLTVLRKLLRREDRRYLSKND